MMSYAEITEADAFFAGRTEAAHWLKLNEEVKLNALERGSRMLDEAFDWKGIPANELQPLRWPRKNAVDSDGNPIDPETIPLRIRIAAMEQALYLTDPFKTLSENGIKSATAGGMSLSLSSESKHSVIAPAAAAAVRSLGVLRTPGTGAAKCGSVLRG